MAVYSFLLNQFIIGKISKPPFFKNEYFNYYASWTILGWKLLKMMPQRNNRPNSLKILRTVFFLFKKKIPIFKGWYLKKAILVLYPVLAYHASDNYMEALVLNAIVE